MTQPVSWADRGARWHDYGPVDDLPKAVAMIEGLAGSQVTEDQFAHWVRKHSE